MAELESMKHSSELCEIDTETKDYGEECNIPQVVALELHHKNAIECLEKVQALPSRKFNNEQCKYLVEKLQVVVKLASLFLEGLDGATPCEEMERSVENFKILVALAKKIQSFILGCSKDEWIQAAMTLANIPKHVSSMGFNLEMCKIAFCKGSEVMTHDGIIDINRGEVKVVEEKALEDVETLFAKLIFELTQKSLGREESDLAIYLLHRLKGRKPIPPCVSSSSSWWENFDDWVQFGNLFKWVQVTGTLGRGSSATVCKGMWLGTPIAKKMFYGPENEDFKREVGILTRLHHPNIMSMFCSVMSRRTCSIVMELMDEDLYSLIQKRCDENNVSAPFSILEAVDIMLQVGEGINYLHDKGIVHRDLKSMNILVKMIDMETGYFHIKVADFGLSKVKENSICYSNASYNVGTQRWMAPEIIHLSERSHSNVETREEEPKYPFKCDIYSFAMVCYEILTGDVPFQSEKMLNNVKKRVLQGDRPNLPCHCPLELKALIMECWNHEPNKRPSFPLICSKLKYFKYVLMTGNKITNFEQNLEIEGQDVGASNATSSFRRIVPWSLTCVVCHKSITGKWKCLRCQKIYYCSRECEVQDWNHRHKFECESRHAIPIEETTSSYDKDNDPLPGISCFQVVGDPLVGHRLTACGHCINGTHLAIFQWIRHYRDGSECCIEGAFLPTYVITADDVDNVLAVECIPLDERVPGRRGELVKFVVNGGKPIGKPGISIGDQELPGNEAVFIKDVSIDIEGLPGHETERSPNTDTVPGRESTI